MFEDIQLVLLVISMTAQIPDKFRYEGEAYDIVGLDGDPLYAPQDFGITTQMASPACWRGYQMFYDCKDGKLILDQLGTLNTTQWQFLFAEIWQSSDTRTTPHRTSSVLIELIKFEPASKLF